MDRKSEEKSPRNSNSSPEEHSQPRHHYGSDLGAPSQEWEERESRPREWLSRDYDRFQPREAQVPSSVAVGDDQHEQQGGYASSSGAMSSDERAAYASRYYASSTRSVGSSGSQEGERFVSYTTASLRCYGGPPSVGHLSEPRFPSHNVCGALSYAASEAAKSDIATVCSGSVIEDIEVSSMLSAELNPPQTPSSEKAALAFAAATSGGSRRSSSGGRVEFASLAHYATIQVPGLPLTLHQADRGSPFQQGESSSLVALNDTITATSDMGPPLSRALLLQPPGTGSCPGSVKSFGSKGSDMIAHVDTDDCGGSIIESVTDGHSVHSQEDTGTHGETSEAAALSNERTEQEAENALMEGEQAAHVHPLLQNSNGRMSPGGTVYKGKGVRRYKGRYMHLPLKRFTQNGVNMESVVRDSLVAGPLPTPRGHPDEYDYRRGADRGGGWREERGSPPNGPNGYRGREHRASEQYAARKRSRSPSRSRSRSPPPARRRSRSHSPKRKNPPRPSFRRNGDGSSHSPNRHWNGHGRSKSNGRSGPNGGNAGSPQRGYRRSRRS